MSLQEYDPLSPEDTPLNDRKKVKAKGRKANVGEKERRATLKGILDVKEGRRWIWWVVEQCGPLQFPVNLPRAGEPVDVPATMVNIGAARIGNLLIAEILAAAPEKFAQMMTESKEITDAG